MQYEQQQKPYNRRCEVCGRTDTDYPDLEFTCFSGFEDALLEKGARFIEAPAVTSGRIVTGRSAGHALAFGLQILARMGSPRVDEVDYALHLDTE